MYKKLVKYDQWHFAEVDPFRLKRTALVLQAEIMRKVKRDNDLYTFHALTIPIVEAAIRGEILESLDDDLTPIISANFDHDRSEGFLPAEYDSEFVSAVAAFDVAVQGLSLEDSEKVEKGGATYAWLECEEEGDWPDKVKYR